MTSPRRRVRSPTTTWPSRTSIPAAPTTAGMPQPRATTAAWLARPPREVRMPAARAIPWTSSGDVSARTRIAARPASAAAWAASGLGHDRAAGHPGRGRQPGDERQDGAAAGARDRSADGRAAGDPLDRFRARERERLVLGHVDGDPERGLRAALADPDLEHPEPALLDRELDVAQVGVVALEPRRVVAAARRRPRAGARPGRAIGSVRWVPATTSSPWASNITSP